MNNLHRELAPISGAAWSAIEEEASRTFKRHIAGRRVVDLSGPHGYDYSAVGLGRTAAIDEPADGVLARQRRVARWSNCGSRSRCRARRSTTWNAAPRTPIWNR